MDKKIKEMAKYCCYPCEMEHDGRCIEGNDPCKCSIALTTAEALYKAGYAEIKHGKWIEWVDYPTLCGKATLYVCSECTAKYTEISHYCPHCGAIMDGERKSENE